EAIFAPFRQHVQRKPNLPQKRLRRLELAQLALGEEAVLHELIERFSSEVALGDPTDGLNVAQAAGAGLDVRLEVVGGVVVAMMPCRLLGDFRLENRTYRPDALRASALRMASNKFFGPLSRRASIK